VVLSSFRVSKQVQACHGRSIRSLQLGLGALTEAVPDQQSLTFSIFEKPRMKMNQSNRKNQSNNIIPLSNQQPRHYYYQKGNNSNSPHCRFVSQQNSH
jgi:hypothetical protein